MLTAALQAQSVSQPYSVEVPVTIPTSAFDIRFSVSWISDDTPLNSAPGRIELLNGATLVGRVVASNYRSSGATLSVTGEGTVDEVYSYVVVYAPNGTPADGFFSATWHVTGLTPGNYTVRAWTYQTADRRYHASTVWTDTSYEGGSSPAPTNRAPTVTLIEPGTQSVIAGTTLTIGSRATDPDGNLTNHNLDIQRPDGAWNYEGGFAAGEPYQGGPIGSAADSNRSANFTFTDVGTYTIRAAANDGSGWVQSVPVAITVVAPPPVQFVLTTASSAGGSVSPGGVFEAGTNVMVTANADSAHDFAGWSGDAGGSANPLSLTMDRAKFVQAHFAAKNFSLVTSAVGGGSVTPGGNYPIGTTVTISAAPDATHRFIGWSGDASGNAGSIALTLTRPLVVQAQFELKGAQTISFPPVGDQAVGTNVPLNITSTSGLPVSVSITGPATYHGGVLTPTGPGAITIQASQAGDGNYLPAPPVTRTFNATVAAVVRYRVTGRTILHTGHAPEAIPYVIQPNP